MHIQHTTIFGKNVKIVYHSPLSGYVQNFLSSAPPPIKSDLIFTAYQKSEDCSILFNESYSEAVFNHDDVEAASEGRRFLIVIGFLQALYRFVSISYIINNDSIHLLHGCAVASPEGEGIAILDDGNGTGKSSLMAAMCLQGYLLVADEFTFWNSANLRSQPLSRSPVHLRPDVASHLLPNSNKILGKLLEPNSVFEIASEPTRTGVFLFPRAASTFALSRLSKKDLLERIGKSAGDHLKKLVNPELDRVSFLPPGSNIDVNGLSSALDRQERRIVENLSRARVMGFEVGLPSISTLKDCSRDTIATIASSF
jgi:hypothetical protein